MATNQELIDYYADLLILQYKGKPKAYATIQAFVTMLVMNQLPIAVQNAFDVETAVGVQLDILGKYAGVTRKSRNFTGQIILSDDDFRLLIKMKLVQNNSGSSLKEIQDLLFTYFPGVLYVYDFANMTMGYAFDAAAGSMNLAEVFVREGLLPKPMGVQLQALIYINDIANIFGFNSYSLPDLDVNGFNTYADYKTDRPWLSYQDAIVF